MFPMAIITTLFRPYPWEAKNPVMLISAIESAILLVFFVFTVYKFGIKLFFRKIFSSPILTFMLCYSLFFAGLVAITTNTFGSLVRYKILTMPFFLALLIILISQIKNIKHRFLGKYIFTASR